MDPFLAVKEEVEHSVKVVASLYEKFQDRDREANPEEVEWNTSELLSGLRSIEWDLQDLDDTVQIVEKSPAKFNIQTQEIQDRKDFIEKTRQKINHVKKNVQDSQLQASAGFSTKKHNPVRGIPSVGAKAKGYGKVLADDEDIATTRGGALRPMQLAVDDESLPDLKFTPTVMRHKWKKFFLCAAIWGLIIFLVVASIRAGTGRQQEVVFHPKASPPSPPPPSKV